MISIENTRVPVLTDRKKLQYLKQLVQIYNDYFDGLKYNEKIGLHKISVSELFRKSLNLLILDMDRQLHYEKGKNQVHKEIFEYISKH